ncbi:MAG: hypothetical protein WAW88_06480, partial [Nocardioides sp.]
SVRFGLPRPKFLLQHPQGETMLTAGLRGIDAAQFDGVVVVSLEEYFAPHSPVSAAALVRELEAALGVSVDLRLLPEATASQVDTIEKGVEALGGDGPFVVKDSDNYVGLPAGWWREDRAAFVAYGDLAKFPAVVAANKSYVIVGALGYLQDMVEKRVVSSSFNVGTVGFTSASQFVYARAELELGREAFVSDVVSRLLAEGQAYQAVEVEAYEDWGDLAAWRRYCEGFATVFCDLDGVLAHNAHPLDDSGGWESFDAIAPNVAALHDRFPGEQTRFVFATSRAERVRPQVQAALEAAGFTGFDLLMGLPHATRFLINDFAATTGHPTAVAINLPRNAPTLSTYL